MTDSKDAEIIAAIKEGNNSAALNGLYRNALPKIVRFILQNKGDEDEAKDIFQDAAVALFHTIKTGKYDHNKDITGFLYFVSRNLWINRIKKKNKQFTIRDTETWAENESPLVNMIEQEKQTAIEELMEKIGTQCKDILRFALHDKLSMKEVAEKMGFASDNVAKNAHYRCKQKLATLILENKSISSLLKG